MTALRRTLIVLGGLVALLAVTAGGVFLYFNSDAGKVRLAKGLGQLLSQNGLVWQVGRIEGDLPGDIRLRQVSVSDGLGTWLEIPKLDFRWQPKALLSRQLLVRQFSVQHPQLYRQPELERTTAAGGPMPALPVDIRIERFTMEALVIEEAVFGQAAKVEAEGSVSLDGKGDLVTRLQVSRSDAEHGRLQLEARYHLQDETLDLAALFKTAPGGLLDEITGLPGLDLSLTGNGPLADWRGMLRARSGVEARLDADLHLSSNESGAVLGVEATASVAELLPADFALLATGPLGLNGSASVDSDGILTVPDMRLESDGFSLNLRGNAGSNKLDLDAELQMNPPGVEWVNLQMTGIAVDSLDVSARITGPPSRPTVGLDYAVGRVSATAPMAFEAIGARGNLSLVPAVKSKSGQPVQVAVKGTLETRLEGLSEVLNPIMSGPVSLKFDGELETGTGRIAVNATRLTLPSGTLEASGNIGLTAGSPSGLDLELTLPALAPFEPLTGLALSGAARIEATVDNAGGAEDVLLTLNGLVMNPQLAIIPADSLLQDSMTFSVRLMRSTSGRIAMDDLSIAGAHIRILGEGVLAPGEETLTGTFRAELPRLAEIRGLPTMLAGSGVVNLKLSGSPASPLLQGDVEASDLSVDEYLLGNGTLNFEASPMSPVPTGNWAMTLQVPELGHLEAGSLVSLGSPDRVVFEQVRLSGMGITVRSDLAVDLPDFTAEGQLEAEASEFGTVAALFGLDFDGDGRLAVKLDAESGTQRVIGTARVGDLSLSNNDGPWVKAKELTADFRLSGLTDTATGVIEIDLFQGALGDLTAKQATLSINSESAGKALVSLAMDGTGETPYQLNTTANLLHNSAETRLLVEALTFAYRGQSMQLLDPTTITIEPDHQSLTRSQFSVGDGTLSVSGHLAEESMALAVDSESLPLQVLSVFPAMPNLEGDLDGQLQLQASPEEVSGETSIRVKNVTSEGFERQGIPPLTLATTGRWDGRELALHGELTGLRGVNTVIDMGLPLTLDWESRQWEIPAAAPVSGEMQLAGDLAVLQSMPALEGHKISGRIDGGLVLEGNLENPRFRGDLGLIGGIYSNHDTGTEIVDLEIELTGNDAGELIVSGKGSDGGSGQFELSGRIDPAGESGFTFDLYSDFKQMLLIDLEDLKAQASGGISLNGTPDNLKIAGEVVVDRAELWLGERNHAGPELLDVVEINLPDGDVRVQEKREYAESLKLDLVLKIPRRAYLRGSGLDTEWAGNLEIMGNADSPLIAGVLRPVRGGYTFLGKAFELATGSVRFDGESMIDPVINLPFEYSDRGITAVFAVSGTASTPDVTLSSRPPLPESEIVSRVLFGAGSNSLTQGQQIELASNLAMMRSSGPGFLDRARRQLGVDVLSLGDGRDGETTTVRAGKYLTERVYLELEQGGEREDGKTTVEVEVAPNIKLQTGTRGGDEGRFGIKWRKDY